MSQVCLAIRDNGVVRSAHIHKGALNALQDMALYAPSMDNFLINDLITQPMPIVAPHEYGLVVVDRDHRWLGSRQDYMSLATIAPPMSPKSLLLADGIDVAKELAHLTHNMWPAALMDEMLRTKLLVEAYNSGAITRVTATHFSEDMAWQTLEELKLNTLDKACVWLDEQRERLTGGKMVMSNTAFGFDPPGWSVVDYTTTPEGAVVMASDMMERGWRFDPIAGWTVGASPFP